MIESVVLTPNCIINASPIIPRDHQGSWPGGPGTKEVTTGLNSIERLLKENGRAEEGKTRK